MLRRIVSLTGRADLASSLLLAADERIRGVFCSFLASASSAHPTAAIPLAALGAPPLEVAAKGADARWLSAGNDRDGPSGIEAGPA